MVRHENGTYYLRAKVAGKCVYAYLKTTSLKIAKIKRNDRLAKERSKAAARRGMSKTLQDAVNVLEADLMNRPNIRPKTMAACGDVIRILRDTLPLTAHGGDWSRQEAAEWWAKIGAKYLVSVANKLHGAVRKLAGILIEHGLRVDDPTRELQRMRPRKALRTMPGRDEMTRIIEFIRGQKKRGCLQSSRLVGFLAFSCSGVPIAYFAAETRATGSGGEFVSFSGKLGFVSIRRAVAFGSHIDDAAGARLVRRVEVIPV